LSAVSGASSAGCAEACEAPDGIFSPSSWGDIAGADTAASFRRLMDRSKRTAARRTTEETQQHAFVGGIEQIVPIRRRAQKLRASHEYQRIVRDCGPHAAGVLETHPEGCGGWRGRALDAGRTFRTAQSTLNRRACQGTALVRVEGEGAQIRNPEEWKANAAAIVLSAARSRAQTFKCPLSG
jgi:hypothetical protein